jgi:hypothetical protein
MLLSGENFLVRGLASDTIRPPQLYHQRTYLRFISKPDDNQPLHFNPRREQATSGVLLGSPECLAGSGDPSIGPVPLSRAEVTTTIFVTSCLFEGNLIRHRALSPDSWLSEGVGGRCRGWERRLLSPRPASDAVWCRIGVGGAPAPQVHTYGIVVVCFMLGRPTPTYTLHPQCGGKWGGIWSRRCYHLGAEGLFCREPRIFFAESQDRAEDYSV